MPSALSLGFHNWQAPVVTKSVGQPTAKAGVALVSLGCLRCVCAWVAALSVGTALRSHLSATRSATLRRAHATMLHLIMWATAVAGPSASTMPACGARATFEITQCARSTAGRDACR